VDEEINQLLPNINIRRESIKGKNAYK